MFYGVKLNGQELYIYGKEGLVFLHFTWSKKLTKIFKWKSVCKGGRGREYILADKLNCAKKKSKLNR